MISEMMFPPRFCVPVLTNEKRKGGVSTPPDMMQPYIRCHPTTAVYQPIA